MRVLDLADLSGRSVDVHGSRGFSVAALGICADAHLVAVRLDPGGVIGRHPAVGRQVLVAVDGDATVAGADGEPRSLGVGQAAVWEPGESHVTSTERGFVGFLVEGDLDLDTRPGAIDAP